MISTTRVCHLLLQSLALVSALLCPPGALASGTNWDLQLEEENITVYTRPVDGSPYDEVKGTVRISAPVARVAELMGDGSRCVEWRVMCASSEVIETVSEHERYVYLVLDLPWPAKDRDMVLHSVTTIDPDSFIATVTLRKRFLETPPADYVRAQSSGRFVIEALGPEEVEFTYIMHTDLGGDLPAGVINARLVEGAFDDLQRLARLAEG